MRAAFALSVLAACGSHAYVSHPETASSAFEPGIVVAHTPIKDGVVEVGSYGVTQLTADGKRFPVLHARMAITNDGDDKAWHVDARQQLFQLSRGRAAAPLYVNAESATLPDIVIRRHERRVVDLYFALPEGESSADRVPTFELQWHVASASSQTELDRTGVAATDAYALDAAWPLGAGYGPTWWHDAKRAHIDNPVVIGRFGGRFDAGTRVSSRRGSPSRTSP